MKLLCVVASYYPAFQYGGPITSTHTLHKALVKKGVDVTVYTTNAGLGGSVSLNTPAIIDGVKVIYFPFTKILDFMGATGWQYSRSMTAALKDHVREFDLVYVVAVWNAPTAIASWFCQKLQKPYIISPRGQLYPEVLKKKFFKKWLYYRIITKRLLRNASAIHYTTQDEANRCHASLKLTNKAIIIPHGIHRDDFRDLPPENRLEERFPSIRGKKVILFLGRITWKKGFDILIEAIAKLLKIRDDIHLLIVGNDDEGYLSQVTAWIKQYKIEQHVTIIGALQGTEKMETFTGSDLFVLPSYSENFGMTIIEALACGLPIIISDKVGIHDDIRRYKAGLIVNTTAESLYNAMIALLDDTALQQSLVENGKKLVHDCYDIETVSDRMIESFRNIINEHS